MLGTPLGLRRRVELSTLGVRKIQSSSVIVLTLTYNLLKRNKFEIDQEIIIVHPYFV